MSKPSDVKLVFIKFTRVLSYLVYAYVLIAVTFLGFAFFLLLFGANSDTPFVQFIYRGANDFMQPFRGIFPTHPVGETGYLNSSMLFAIIFYLLFAAAVNTLISYINVKMVKHENELVELEKKNSSRVKQAE